MQKESLSSGKCSVVWALQKHLVWFGIAVLKILLRNIINLFPPKKSHEFSWAKILIFT